MGIRPRGGHRVIRCDFSFCRKSSRMQTTYSKNHGSAKEEIQGKEKNALLESFFFFFSFEVVNVLF